MLMNRKTVRQMGIDNIDGCRNERRNITKTLAKQHSGDVFPPIVSRANTTSGALLTYWSVGQHICLKHLFTKARLRPHLPGCDLGFHLHLIFDPIECEGENGRWGRETWRWWVVWFRYADDQGKLATPCSIDPLTKDLLWWDKTNAKGKGDVSTMERRS